MRFVLLLSFLGFWSCQGRQNDKAENTTSDSVAVADTVKIVISDSTLVDTVGLSEVKEEETINTDSSELPLGLEVRLDFEENGSKRSAIVNDSLFADFLIAFTSYQNEAYRELYNHPNFVEFDAIAYTQEDELSEIAIKFRDSVKQIGFLVASSEGAIYYDKDPDFLELFSPYLSERMNSFLKEYCKDIISPFTEDNSIIVSPEENIRRMMFWENFQTEHTDFELPDYAKNEFTFLLFRFMMGTGNSAIHDWENPPKIRTEMLDAYKSVVNQYPNSIAAEYLTDYLVFLEQGKFIWDRQRFLAYGREKFPSMYGL